MAFRNAVFELCKILQRDIIKDEISSLMINLNCYKEGQAEPNRSNYGYLGKSLRNQFHGFLFIDEKRYSIAELKETISLSVNEKTLLHQGHMVLTDFIDNCLEDIKKEAPHIAKVIDPYSRYIPIQKISVNSRVKTDVFEQCVSEFKNTAIYKKLIESSMWQIIKSMPEGQIERLVGVLDKEIIHTSLDNVPDEIRNFSFRRMQSSLNTQDLLMRDACIILSLREMLANACQLLYCALVGGDLIVLDNNNLISIDNEASNAVYSYMTVLVQGIIMNMHSDLVGDILLINCEIASKHKIHEFGRIHQATISFNQDEGETTKLTFCLVDDTLNPISNLVNF